MSTESARQIAAASAAFLTESALTLVTETMVALQVRIDRVCESAAPSATGTYNDECDDEDCDYCQEIVETRPLMDEGTVWTDWNTVAAGASAA